MQAILASLELIAEDQISSFDATYADAVEIGVGAEGTVYKCVRKSDGKIVAVKKLAPVSHFTDIKVIYKNAKTIQTFDHPNLLSYTAVLYTVDEDSVTFYFEMTFMDGGTVQEDLEQRKAEGQFFTEKQIVLMAIDICQALIFLHDQNFMHRDIKWENIFCQNDSLVLGDMGRLTVHSQQNMSIAGTPTTVAPEVMNVGRYNKSVDIFSFGAILYQLLSFHSRILFVEFSSRPAKGVFFDLIEDMSVRKYSNDLIQMIISMLSPNPATRPNIFQVYKFFYLRKMPNLPENTLALIFQFSSSRPSTIHRIQLCSKPFYKIVNHTHHQRNIWKYFLDVHQIPCTGTSNSQWKALVEANVTPDLRFLYKHFHDSLNLTFSVIGAGSGGKTSLIHKCVEGQFAPYTKPTVEDVITYTSQYKLFSVDYTIIDTSGQDEHTHLRESYVKKSSAFLYVVGADEPKSLQELPSFVETILSVKNVDFFQVPLVIVLNKVDIETATISKYDIVGKLYDHGHAILQSSILETSAKTGLNTSTLFNAVITELLRVERLKHTNMLAQDSCTIL